MELRLLQLVARRALVAIVLAAVAGAAMASAAWSLLPSAYQASARIVVDSTAVLVPGQEPFSGDPERYVASEMEVLRSQALADSAGNDMDPPLTAAAILESTEVSHVTGTDVIEVVARASSAGRARETAANRRWFSVAEKLAGLPRDEDRWTTDFISGLVSWSPSVVRGVLHRIEAASGMPWLRAVVQQRTFSEYTTYGRIALADTELAGQLFTHASSLCASHWEDQPLTKESTTELLGSLRATDVAIQVQSFSGTPLALRDELVSLATERARQLAD